MTGPWDTPLNLRIVEYAARSQLRVDAPTVLVLLAHVRALRAVLHEGEELGQRNLRTSTAQRRLLLEWTKRAAAVLAEGKDAP